MAEAAADRTPQRACLSSLDMDPEFRGFLGSRKTNALVQQLAWFGEVRMGVLLHQLAQCT
jgi:hypothetical protein